MFCCVWCNREVTEAAAHKVVENRYGSLEGLALHIFSKDKDVRTGLLSLDYDVDKKASLLELPRDVVVTLFTSSNAFRVLLSSYLSKAKWNPLVEADYQQRLLDKAHDEDTKAADMVKVARYMDEKAGIAPTPGGDRGAVNIVINQQFNRYGEDYAPQVTTETGFSPLRPGQLPPQGVFDTLPDVERHERSFFNEDDEGATNA